MWCGARTSAVGRRSTVENRSSAMPQITIKVYFEDKMFFPNNVNIVLCAD